MMAIKDFFTQLLDPNSRVTTDVYAYMFMCDFINFMVVLVGFPAFGVSILCSCTCNSAVFNPIQLKLSL